MENYTPERIRQDFVSPLLKLAADLNSLADDLQKASDDKVITRDYLPLNSKMPLNGVALLRKLHREIRDKLEGAKEGMRIWRETELRRKREEYAAQKSKRKKKNVD